MEGEIGIEQLEFRQGRGTTDGMFALGQLMEKKLEGQEDMAVRFIDLEKAYDTIQRELTMATLRWRGPRGGGQGCGGDV